MRAVRLHDRFYPGQEADHRERVLSPVKQKETQLPGLQPLMPAVQIEQKEPPKVNKNFIFLVPMKNRVPFYGHYMMGIVLKVNAQSHC